MLHTCLGERHCNITVTQCQTPFDNGTKIIKSPKK